MPENRAVKSNGDIHTRAMIDLVFVIGIPVAILLAITVDIVSRSMVALAIFAVFVILIVLSVFYIRTYKKDWAKRFNSAWNVWTGRLPIENKKASEDHV